jgi:ribosomal-protein-alanine N-acetyltransferase
MDFVFESMSDKEARKIAAWKYEPPYAFYDMAKDPEDLEELLAPDKRKDYFSATSDGVLVGYFCFGRDARVSGGDYSGEAVDVGLGMRPDLTGKGLGLSFLESGLGFARERFSPTRFRLSVAAFNERAIKVYERAGFEKSGEFIQRTNGGEHPFVLMTRPA